MLTIPQTNIADPVNVTILVLSRLNVVIDTQADTIRCMDISYLAGNMSADIPPVFRQEGEPLFASISSDQCAALLVSNPNLFVSLKAIIDPLLGQQYGLAGAVS